MLLVFLSLFVFLLSLVFAIIQFQSQAGNLKKLPLMLIALSVLLVPGRAPAQIAEPDQTSPASSPANDPPETAGPSAQSAEPSAQPWVSTRPVSWKLLFRKVMSDQKHIWTFPLRLAQGENWVPTAAVLGTAAGLTFADPKEAAYFRNTTSFNTFKSVVTGNGASISMGAVPASLYVIGLIRKDTKMQRTALFAGEALADTAIVQTVLKDALRRVKPARYPANGWFESKGPPTSYLRGNGSFPSGHSMAAFSVATVFARQYRNHRWVPYVAYSLAALVGFSRLPLNVHFLSDVAVGGAIGYSISRFTVLRQ